MPLDNAAHCAPFCHLETRMEPSGPGRVHGAGVLDKCAGLVWFGLLSVAKVGRNVVKPMHCYGQRALGEEENIS